jgi:hypothetical protein
LKKHQKEFTMNTLPTTSTIEVITPEQARTLIDAMREEIEQAASYCERFARERTTREQLAHLLEEEEDA